VGDIHDAVIMSLSYSEFNLNNITRHLIMCDIQILRAENKTLEVASNGINPTACLSG
jgi:hypothetical protein